MAKGIKRIKIPRISDVQIMPDTAVLNPILENDTLMCLHGGKVELKAKDAKRIASNNVPIMLNDEIQGANISGCVNPAMLGGPCQKVAMVFPYTYSNHRINQKNAVLQLGLIGVSDKGFPILAIPKQNTIRFSLVKMPAPKIPSISYGVIQWKTQC